MLLTIFTPTYNRAYTLKRLYKSLCNQTCGDFEWLLIDDGSTDDTYELADSWKKENSIRIRYEYKENGGKASAYNLAAEKAMGVLFLCVDSDDHLVDDAVETIKKNWEKEEKKKDQAAESHAVSMKRNPVIGQLYYKANESGGMITRYPGDEAFSTLIGFYRQHGLQGDTMLVYKTEVVRRHPFPTFEGEKFVPEMYVYDQYDQEGVLHLYREALYISEYLPDGYTASIRNVNYRNPKGYEAAILQRIRNDTSLLYKIQDTIRYIAIKLVQKDGKLFSDCESRLMTILLLIPGWIFYQLAYSGCE